MTSEQQKQVEDVRELVQTQEWPEIGRGSIMNLLSIIDALTAENEALNTFLHSKSMHPDYEYRTTDGPRKAWDGDPDLTKEGWIMGEWERFDYHEEITWRRLKSNQREDGTE